MSTEATIQGDAPVGGVANTVLPEAPMPKAEAPQDSTPQAEATPAPEQTDVQIYQSLIAREAAGEKVDMTEAEVDAFMSVQEQIHTGIIKDPGLPSDTKTDSPTTSEPKAEEKPTETESPEPKPETETPSETATEAPPLTDKVADYLQKAMTKVGAKDITELPDKVEGLINQMRTTGGKLGGERAELQKQMDQHVNWVQGMRSGDPNAIAHLEKLTGLKINGTTAPQEATAQGNSDLNIGDPEEFIDNKLAPVVKNLIQEVKDLKAQNQTLLSKETQRDQLSQEATAVNAWVDDVVGLVADHSDSYGVNTSEARALAKFYWSPEGAKTAVHPKFQKIHELIDFAHKNNMPDLETAHVMLQHKNGTFTQTLIAERQKGQKEAQHIESPNAAISSKQGRVKQDVPDPHITDDSVAAMEKGDLGAIPDEWMDEIGNLIPDKVPQRFHAQAFGRAGKPK
jgi:hypothetical protein